MAASPRVLALAATAAPDAADTALSLEIARQLAIAGCDADVATLADYPLPLFDAAVPGPGTAIPLAAKQLAERLTAQDALVLVAPLLNGSLAPMAKNAVDWIERAGQDAARRPAPFAGLVVALAAFGTEPEKGEALLEAWRPVIAALGAEPPEPALVLASLDAGEAAETFAQSLAARLVAAGRHVY